MAPKVEIFRIQRHRPDGRIRFITVSIGELGRLKLDRLERVVSRSPRGFWPVTHYFNQAVQLVRRELRIERDNGDFDEQGNPPPQLKPLSRSKPRPQRLPGSKPRPKPRPRPDSRQRQHSRLDPRACLSCGYIDPADTRPSSCPNCGEQLGGL